MRITKFTFVASLVAYGASLHAQPVPLWSDNLESGLANWTATSGTGRAISLQTGTNQVPSGGNQSLLLTNSSCRAYVNSLPSGLGISSAADSVRFSYWLYDPSTPAANLSVRGFAEVRSHPAGHFDPANATGYDQILAIGHYNTFTLGPSMPSKYCGRIVSGVPSGWFYLTNAPNRSAGWHHFEIERGVNAAGALLYKFYQDGILGAAWTNSRSATADVWNSVLVGNGGGTSAGNVWHDGYEVVQGQAFIADEPKNSTNLLSSPASFSVYAYGSADSLYYWWFKDGVLLTDNANISGAQSSTLNIASCQPADQGFYSVMVSNYWGARTSAFPAYLSVGGVQIVTHPTNQVVNLGSNNVAFYCEAVSASGAMGFQWMKDGVAIPAATEFGYSSTCTIPTVGISDLASAPGYTCVVTNDQGHSATSAPGTLVSNAPPALTAYANVTTNFGVLLAIPATVTDDFSSGGLFQTFEGANNGATVMFQHPRYSGTAQQYVSAQPGATAPLTFVTNANLPSGNALSQTKALYMQMTFTNETQIGWDRVTTLGFNPTIWFLGPLKFDIWTDRPMGVSVGLHESNPSGAIGSNGGTSSSIESAGVSSWGSIPNYIYSTTAGTWTNFTYDLASTVWPPDEGTGFLGWAQTYIQGAGLVGGDGILDSTTGKGVIENLGLIPADGLGTYHVYLDNFRSVGPNFLRFTLSAAPEGATIDPFSGLITWTLPNTPGTHNFTVVATDHLGLTDTKSFSITAASPAPGPLSITRNGTQVELNWSGTFQLQKATSLHPPNFSDVLGVTTGPHQETIGTGPAYYRLQN